MSLRTYVAQPAWQRLPLAEQALRRALRDVLGRCSAAASFEQWLLTSTAVRLRDIVDHIAIADERDFGDFADAGWSETKNGEWRNSGGLFPAVVRHSRPAIWLRVENVALFLRAYALDIPIEGPEHGPVRKAVAFSGDGVEVGIIERNGWPGMEVPEVAPSLIRRARIHGQIFRTRRRNFDSVEQGLRHTESLVDSAVGDLGPHWSCSIWLGAERDYWVQRCRAGRVQKERQDRAGIGWSNIDHHTYDGSRAHFRHSIRIFEKLGYELREMLYAGELAGWGSQVLEQPVIGSTIFADVDLAPDELAVDFSHEELPPLGRHRRAGLLSFLLGESILAAGLNHVAGLYDQAALRAQLAEFGVTMMAPFSDFTYLYQELTEGQRGPVDPRAVDLLERGGHIGAEEAEMLRLEGAIISHLENIERNEGYKGFNRDGIDSVLRKLDPRAYHSGPAPVE